MVLSAMAFALAVSVIAVGCDNGDEGEDQGDDATGNDRDECGPSDICARSVECGAQPDSEACVEWFSDESNCYDMPKLVECGCYCLSDPGCGGYISCLDRCVADHCPVMPDLPDDPQIPAVPAQKEPPATVDLSLIEEQDGPRISGGGLDVKVVMEPFSIEVMRQEDGETLLRSGKAGPATGFAPIAFTQNDGFYWNDFYWGYRGYTGVDQPWARSLHAIRYWAGDDRVFFEVRADMTTRGRTLFVVGPFYDGSCRIAAAVASDEILVNRLGFTFISPADERYVGFGERFNSIDQRGRTIESWSEEGGIEPGYLRPLLEQILPDITDEWALPSGEDGSYCPIPFFLSNRGYGLLADAPEPSRFDLGREYEDLWRIAVESDALSIVVFAGPTPADALAQYTERTGRSQAPRPWMFAPWNMFVGYPGLGMLDVARLFREHDIPSSVTHSWTDITPTGGFRGREAGLMAENDALHDLGYRSLCYLQPRIDADRYPELWEEAAGLDLLTRDINGDPYVQTVYLNIINLTEFHVSHVDFTSSGVDDWWHGVLQTIIDLGYDGTMYDFGEYTPPNAFFSDGRCGHYWHNPYPLIYQRSGYRFFKELDDDPDDGLAPDYVYFHRSGYVGSQNWTYAMWSGDPNAGWSVADGLPAQVCAGVNAGLSGLPFWGSDVGGYHAYLTPAPTAELLMRWVEFGAFSGLMRDMTAPEIYNGRRVLAFDDPEVTYVIRRYQKLRTQLVPYIVNAAWEHREKGLPIMRAPLLHYPDDPAAWDIKREYMFGPDLYVAPVVEEGASRRTLYLPEGEWIELWALTEYDGDLDGNGSGGFRIGGAPIEGGREITVDAPTDQIPVFVRMGAAIPLVDPRVDSFVQADPPEGDDVTTYDDMAHLLHLWAFPEGTTETTLADGSTIEVEETTEGVTLTRHAAGDDAELIAQVVWPAGTSRPQQIPGLDFVPGADPLALEPGTWTWSDRRNSVGLHGMPGQTLFEIRTH